MGRLPKYVFRGSTINFEGGISSKKYGYTCTTKHPVKATLFALECANHYPEQAVIYVAETKNLMHLKRTSNVLKKQEEELAWKILPKDFASLVEGYIHLGDIQKVLKTLGFDTYEIVGLDNLNRLCRETPPMSANKMRKFLQEIQPYLKK